MLMYIHMRPIHDLIVQHPVLSVLTVAFCLVVFVVGVIFCYGVITYKRKH